MIMSWSRLGAVCVIGALGGCSPYINPPDDDGAPANGSTGGSNGGTSIGSSTTGLRLDLGGDATTTDPVDSTGAVDTAGFIEDPSGGTCGFDPSLPGQPRCLPCDLWQQDCPAGEKCGPRAQEFDGFVDYRTVCGPVPPNPAQLGEPCVVEDALGSGFDDCNLGLTCFNVDFPELTGECVALCQGSQTSPECPGDTTCVIASDGVHSLCLPSCDPRDPMPCAEGQGCYWFNDRFACTDPGAPMYVGNPNDANGCEFPASCEPDTVCYADVVGPQCDDPPCCTPWCDTMDPDPDCPADTACTSSFEPDAAPTGLETLGWCAPAP